MRYVKCLLFVLLYLLCVQVLALGDQLNTQGWPTNPALISKLGDKTSVGDLASIMPPKGYTLQAAQSSDGVGTVYHWTGTAGVKGYVPVFDVIVAKQPLDSQTATTDQVMASLVSNFHEQKKNWKLSNVTIGPINGQVFHRVDWSGLDQSKKLNIQGVVFGAELAPGTFLLVSAEDAEPDSKTAIPIMVASALTISKP